jgi:hypothetical protein
MKSQDNEKNKNKIKFSIQNTLVDETKVGIKNKMPPKARTNKFGEMNPRGKNF